MSDVFCNVLFPTFIVYTDKPETVKQETVNFAKTIINENANRPFHSDCLSTVKTIGDILEYKEFAEIKKDIIYCLGAYCKRTKVKSANLKFSGSWLNLYNEHGYQDLHAHSGSMISGVYYLKSDGEKDLIFQSPYHFFQPVEPDYEEIDLENCSNVDYNSNVGRCIIFPSHLMHRTLPAKSERISLSFNITHDYR